MMKRLLVLGVILLAACAAAAAPADENAQLRQFILKLNTVLDDSAQEAKVEELIQNPAQLRRLLPVARQMNEEKSSPLAYSANYILGNAALELRDLPQAQFLFEKAVAQGELLKSDKKVTMAYLGLIDVHVAGKQYDEADKISEKLLKREPEDEEVKWIQIGQAFALRKRVQIACLRGKPEEGLKKLEDYNQSSPFILETKAWVMSYQDKYDEAIAIYEKLLKDIADRKSEAATRERYSRMLGSLYGDRGQIDKATAVLEPLLKENPDDDGLNNDLGYLWAEHGQKLDEAEKMIRKALAGKPNNASYLDSLAWVLHRQKKHEEAKKVMLKAITLRHGNSLEMLEHLGDIHAALNERAEAKAAWQKALDQATSSARDQKRKAEIEKKLKDEGQR